MSKTTSELSWWEARRQNAHADLLAVAWEIVREGGLGALSLRELARRAGSRRRPFRCLSASVDV